MARDAGLLRVGVVGCGHRGAQHVRTLLSLEAVGAVTVVDPSEERRSALTRAFPRVEEHPALDGALDHLDAVVVATPPSSHAALALEAISRDVPVLVDKPLATSSAEGRAVVAAAHAHGVTLMVGHTFEYHAAVWSLREMLQRGDLGDLHYLDTARLGLGLYQHDVNVVLDLAPHDVSILNYVLGSTPSVVECWGSRQAHPRLEDVAHLRLYYEDPGVFANVHVSWLDPTKVRRVSLVGSSRTVVFDGLDAEHPVKVHDQGDVVAPHLAVHEPLRVEDQHFLDCVQTGMRPLTDGANGLAVVEVLEAAERSMREGVAVRLRDLRRPSTPTVPRQRLADRRRAW